MLQVDTATAIGAMVLRRWGSSEGPNGHTAGSGRDELLIVARHCTVRALACAELVDTTKD
ncbi:hypothetical protein BST13_26040 [Mycobacterium aquaticum]|uniref:Uncharacterized protein n=1 Tax=Mycobacterium aquaticum TaxID=1927124 RepID=A0A1X0AMS9_9MYCO|nr:hypothetical protein BST13_26040 [Mycobacterium aquaticum]